MRARKVMSTLHERLTLLRVPGIGPRLYHALADRFGGAGAVLSASRQSLRAAGLGSQVIDALRQPDQAAVEADLAWADAPGNHILDLEDPRYPQLLGSMVDPPPLLFVSGDPDALSTPQLAIVGSRSPSSGGRQNAHDFARHLARSGLTITSGLALGIDTAAHEGALAGDGPTIAVTATGPDRVYPAANRKLAHAIAAQGAVVTEFPTGTPVRAGQFPRRNRIISGLCAGTLVVEAGLRSGSLITARYALEQGREVFAIPGSIHNPLARGCHALIRDGSAKLVETARDIMEELPALLGVNMDIDEVGDQKPEQQASGTDLDSDHDAVLEALGHDPVAMDFLLQRTGLTPAALSSILLILELQGHVTAMPGGRYARTGLRT